MQDLWRLSAERPRLPDSDRRRFRRWTRPRRRWPGWTRSTQKSTRSSTTGRKMCWRRPRAIDAAIARGEDAGPLAGVPVTVKVNIDQQGFATTNGLKLQRDVIAKTNSPVIDNLRKAGAVILGRTNCPAFSYRWFTTNLIHGDTKNPRDPGITPGGSSGGAGAAVAAGIGHIAHGTDIAGSIRYPPMPAACMACGRRWAASPPSMRRCPSARSGRRSRRYRGRSRAPSAICESRSRRCRSRTCAIRGGCRRRWKGRRGRSGPRCVLRPTVLSPLPR